MIHPPEDIQTDQSLIYSLPLQYMKDLMLRIYVQSSACQEPGGPPAAMLTDMLVASNVLLKFAFRTIFYQLIGQRKEDYSIISVQSCSGTSNEIRMSSQVWIVVVNAELTEEIQPRCQPLLVWLKILPQVGSIAFCNVYHFHSFGCGVGIWVMPVEWCLRQSCM